MNKVHRQLRDLLMVPSPKAHAVLPTPKPLQDQAPGSQGRDVLISEPPSANPPAGYALPTYLLAEAGRDCAVQAAPLPESLTALRTSLADAEETALPFGIDHDSPALPFVPVYRPRARTAVLPVVRSEAVPSRGSSNEAALAATQPPFAPALPTLPKSGPASPPYALSLEEYACLCAEVNIAVEAAFSRFGLRDPALRRAVDATWRARLAQHPMEVERWQRLYAHYRTLLAEAQDST